MADPRNPRPKPRDYLVRNAKWPQGPLRDDAPAAVRLAIQISRNLRAAMKNEDLTAKELAERTSSDPETRMSRQTVQNILKGHTLADLPTIARIEDAIGAPIWGDAHITRRKPEPDRQN